MIDNLQRNKLQLDEIKSLTRKLEKQRATNMFKQKVIYILRLTIEKGFSKKQIKESRERVNMMAREMREIER
jgi:hypothetical protein